MKIFNEEKGKKKVYVQLNDIIMLLNMDGVKCPPKEVMDKHYSDIFIVTDENRYEFSEFSEEETIKYFEEQDWIINFKTYKNMNEKEILECAYQINDDMNELKIQFNERLQQLDYDKCDELEARIAQLEFKMNSLKVLFWNKQGHLPMPFPVVPANDGFVMYRDDCEYMACQGLNPLQVLIYRVDGKVLNKKTDVIPQGLIQSAESILINYNLENNEFFGDFKKTVKLSDDQKYLVISFEIIPLKEEKQEKEEKVSLGKRIKNWINRNFK